MRRHLVSASHIIQAGNDLIIGKDEAYIMNRKKKEKSVLRKEGNVYVRDLFMKVASVQADGGWCKQSNCRRKRAKEGTESRSTATTKLFDGRKSEP